MVSLLTRRGFVAATTLGAVGLWRRATSVLTPSADGPLFYVGSYTEKGRNEGLYLMRFDSTTGAMQKVSAVDVGANPSFLAFDQAGKTLLAVNEVNEIAGKPTGALRSFSIDAASGRLAPLSEQASGGTSPCYVSTDRTGRVALVANYGSGTIALLPLSGTGTLSRASQVVQHAGTRTSASGKEQAHAHCIIPHPSNRFALAADLGTDRVYVYRLDVNRATLEPVESSDAVLASGTGPRHLAFHPTLPLVYVAGELNSTVTVLRCDPQTSALSVVQTLVTTPAGWTGQNFPADIHVDATGRTVYVSNRGHNSIAVFSIAPGTGTLAMEQVVSTGGNWPRHFSFDPSGKWLLVANQRSGSISVLARDAGSGRLTQTSQRLDVPMPACIRFF